MLYVEWGEWGSSVWYVLFVRVGVSIGRGEEVVEEVTHQVLGFFRALKEEGVGGGVVLDNDRRVAESTTFSCVDPVQSQLAWCVVREQGLEEEFERGTSDVWDGRCCAGAQPSAAVT